MYHPGRPPKDDGANSWSAEALPWREFPGDDCPGGKVPQHPVNGTAYTPEQVGGAHRWANTVSTGIGGMIIGCARPAFQDPNVTEQAIEYMRLATVARKPFFVAVGL